MRKILMLVFFMSGFFVQAQDKVYLAYFEALNMNSGFQVSATRVFRAYLNQENKYII